MTVSFRRLGKLSAGGTTSGLPLEMLSLSPKDFLARRSLMRAGQLDRMNPCIEQFLAVSSPAATRILSESRTQTSAWKYARRISATTSATGAVSMSLAKTWCQFCRELRARGPR